MSDLIEGSAFMVRAPRCEHCGHRLSTGWHWAGCPDEPAELRQRREAEERTRTKLESA